MKRLITLLGALALVGVCVSTTQAQDPDHPLNGTSHDWGRIVSYAPDQDLDPANDNYEWYDNYEWLQYGSPSHGGWLDPAIAAIADADLDGTITEAEYTAAGGAGAITPPSYLSWNAATEHRCEICHTPHHAEQVAAPLWSHEMSTATYQLYGAAFDNTLNPTTTLTATPGQPTGGKSAACLACHDGTVAVNAYKYTGHGSAEYGAADHPISPTRTRYIGTDLRDDHPVAIDYDVVNDGGLMDVTTPVHPTSLRQGTIETALLFGNQVECMSCHNPHDNQYGGFLVMENRASSLCQSCHRK